MIRCWYQILPEATKQQAPPRPTLNSESSRRVSSGVAAQQSAVPQSHVGPRPTSTSSGGQPHNNNNDVYGNINDVNDWTDDEWDDDDEDDEEIQVPNYITL